MEGLGGLGKSYPLEAWNKIITKQIPLHRRNEFRYTVRSPAANNKGAVIFQKLGRDDAKLRQGGNVKGGE